MTGLGDGAWQVPAHDVTEFAPKRTRYAICIPVLNEGERFARELEELAGLAGTADLLVLDGGSSDGSAEPERLRSHGVRALLVKTGPGRLSAQLRMGYAYALRQGYEGVVTVDANGKDDVGAIPRFLAELDVGFDLVQGSRFLPGGEAVNTPISRLLAMRLIHVPLISLAAGFRYTDTTNGYRAYSRALLLHPKVQPFRDVFVSYELLAYMSVRGPRVSGRVKEIPVARRYPAQGKVPTKISPIRGQLELLATLLRAVSGAFNPP